MAIPAGILCGCGSAAEYKLTPLPPFFPNFYAAGWAGNVSTLNSVGGHVSWVPFRYQVDIQIVDILNGCCPRLVKEGSYGSGYFFESTAQSTNITTTMEMYRNYEYSGFRGWAEIPGVSVNRYVTDYSDCRELGRLQELSRFHIFFNSMRIGLAAKVHEPVGDITYWYSAYTEDPHAYLPSAPSYGKQNIAGEDISSPAGFTVYFPSTYSAYPAWCDSLHFYCPFGMYITFTPIFDQCRYAKANYGGPVYVPMIGSLPQQVQPEYNPTYQRSTGTVLQLNDSRIYLYEQLASPLAADGSATVDYYDDDSGYIAYKSMSDERIWWPDTTMGLNLTDTPPAATPWRDWDVATYTTESYPWSPSYGGGIP